MSDLKKAIESYRRRTLIEGCHKIDPDLGAAVEAAFKAHYTADEVHKMLSAGQVLANSPGDQP